MAIQHIPAQFRPRPYESPWQRNMPQFIMSMLGYYFQDKMASTRQKKQIELQDQKAVDRMTTQYSEEEVARKIEQKHEMDMAKAKADLGEKQYNADMRKDYIQLKDKDSFPKGYEYSDVIMGLGAKSWWVKRKEKAHKLGEIVKTDKGGGKTQIQIVAGWDASGLPHDTRGKPIETGVFEKGPDPYNKFLNTKKASYKLLNEGAEPSPGKMATWMLEWRRSGQQRVTIEQRAEEKFGIGKAITVGEKRQALTMGKQNKAIYGAEGPQFNNLNKQNEVAYWDSTSFDNKTKIIKLPPEAIAAGWTPAKVQARANLGKTVEEVLRGIGVLE